MTNTNSTTVILGDEFDIELRTKLLDVLRSLGASIQSPSDWTIAGSQELEELAVVLDGQTLRVEAETYVGVSITGPSDVVAKVQKLVVARKAP